MKEIRGRRVRERGRLIVIRYGAKERLISPIMARNIAVQASFQLFVLLGLLYAGPSVSSLPPSPLLPSPPLSPPLPISFDHDKLLGLPYVDDPSTINTPTNKLILDTIVFNTFVFLQIFNEFNSRSVNNSMKKRGWGERRGRQEVIHGESTFIM